MAQSTLTWGAVLLVLLGAAACRVAGDATPFNEDDCRKDNAIRYDNDIFVNGMKLNENRPHYFDLRSVRKPHSHAYMHTYTHSVINPMTSHTNSLCILHQCVMNVKQSMSSNTQSWHC